MKKKLLLFVLILIFSKSYSQDKIVLMHEGFDAIAFPPSGWTIIDADADGKNWQRSPVGAWGYHSGSGCATSASFESSTNTALHPNNYLITPKIHIQSNSYDLSWWVCAQSSGYLAEHYKVVVSTTGNSINNFTNIIFEETLNSKATGIQHYRTVDLSSFAGQDIYIAFVHYNCTDKFFLNLDDVEIKVSPDTNLLLNNITTDIAKCELSDSVAISFQVVNDGNDTLYQIPASFRFKSVVYNQVFNTTIKPNDTITYTFTQKVSINTPKIDSIVGWLAVVGDAWINDDTLTYKSWFGPKTVPYSMEFENNEERNDWTIIDGNGDNIKWKFYNSGGNTNDGCAGYLKSSQVANESLISPCILLNQGHTYKISFYYKAGTSYFKEKLKLLYSNQNAPSSNILIDLGEFSNTGYKLVDTIITITQTDNYYFEFNAYSDANKAYVYIDDFKIDEIYDYDLQLLNAFPDYTILPMKHFKPMVFSAIAKNNGLNPLDSIVLNLKFDNNDFSSDTAISLNADTSLLMLSHDTIFTSSLGNHKIDYSLKTSSPEIYFDNNASEFNFSIGDSVLARDNGINTGGLGIGSSGYMGHKIHVPITDTLTSITFYLRWPTIGDTVSASLFTFNKKPLQEIAKTPIMIIATDSGKWYTLPILANYKALTAGDYFLAIKEYNENIALGTNEENFKDSTGYIFYNGTWNTNEYYGFNLTYMLRANFGKVKRLPVVDLGIVSINSPSDMCEVPDSTMISFVIKNYGEHTLSNFKVGYLLNSTTDTIWKACLDSLITWEEKEIQFFTSNLISGNNLLKAFVSIDSDEVAINNSMEYQYTIESQECINSGFEPGEDNLDKWIVFNANSDPFVWDLDYISPIISNTGNNAAIYQYNVSGTVAADDWLFSPCIKPTSDLYNLSFYMKTGENEGTVYPEKLAVWIGNYPNPDSMKTKLWENDSLIALSYQNITVPVQTEPSLIQYIGFHVHSNPNMYYVAIDDVNFCTPASIEEINTSKINVYPNPASESISIYSDLTNYSVELFDVSQRRLLTIDNSPKTINVKNLSSGIYFIKIFSDKNTFFEKLIIR
ncbi:MAG: choice-of-anchor J domain-containing protein [Bacteroidota bacterium]